MSKVNSQHKWVFIKVILEKIETFEFSIEIFYIFSCKSIWVSIQVRLSLITLDCFCTANRSELCVYSLFPTTTTTSNFHVLHFITTFNFLALMVSCPTRSHWCEWCSSGQNALIEWDWLIQSIAVTALCRGS